jgi:hypothetical protein
MTKPRKQTASETVEGFADVEANLRVLGHPAIAEGVKQLSNTYNRAEQARKEVDAAVKSAERPEDSD